ncbi:site-specific DNA-methyltransferase (adenine-specific) [Arthrobacter pascens]|uniref:DNA-methyltransferase n=1 Tax=Arthrobacter pascens TaxID=1677 RepID=UPI00278541D1|nr:site-specific DNA-methyltransferase [Arthrobacter pascens]MDQ0635074.1 site-specific DNA-methyltransferase (adenine-specific) [Arthrobacter pascens]
MADATAREKPKTMNWSPSGPSLIVEGDNLAALCSLPDETFRLIYIDPPFNTGKAQVRHSLKTIRSATGSRLGFKGERYETVKGAKVAYDDTFEDYWSFLQPRLTEAWRLLTDDGTLYLHLDYREVHYAKVYLDSIFGSQCFLNEIIWAYDYGARARKKWPTKHDNILIYVKNPDNYIFNKHDVDSERYKTPGLAVEPSGRDFLPSDVWWHTIVSTMGKEKTGYPTQKPEGVLRRIIQASSKPGDWILDFFAGSGTTGAVAQALGRKFVLIDQNPASIATIKVRLSPHLRSSGDTQETVQFCASSSPERHLAG